MKTILQILSTLMVIFYLSPILHAQPQRSSSRAAVEGYVFDAATSQPMEYANIVLFNQSDSTQITGTVTNSKGYFIIEGLPRGNYFARISYIGFTDSFVEKINANNNSTIDLGKIYLAAKNIGMTDVVVSGQRAPISYDIDKKVINVGENFSASSGTAVDILENVPSVTVDIEGNVSLRGSGNFKVLIDGRPSILDPGDALQQIPASSIENIEIITNPSAKYDPEGTAGIINVILKKSHAQGLSGVFELNGGLKNKYGGEAIADIKTEAFQSNIGVNYNKRNFGGSSNEKNWTDDGSQISYYNSNGSSSRQMEFYGLRGSISFELGDKKLLSLGGRYNNRTFSGNSNLDYSEWTSENQSPNNLFNNSKDSRGGDGITVYVNYQHPFEDKEHKLSAEVSFQSENSDEENINRLYDLSELVSGQITAEKGPSKEIETKIDYTLPLGTETKFEAGLEGEFEYDDEATSFSNYNPETGQFEINPLYNKDISYDKNEGAVYTMFSSKYEKLGYQVGFRTEYTGRSIELKGNNQDFTIDKWDYFPSAHLSYEFLTGHQMMTSYTRRINRPRGWELEPFETWMNAYNIRVGNPALLPEYIDSYEFGYQTFFGKSVLSVEGYYRITNNRIERIQSVYSEKVTLNSVENIGKDYSLGTELFFNFDPITNWNVNLMGNIYDYRIKGVLYGEDFSRNSFNWNFRFNNTFKLSESTQIQLNANYSSPSVSAQGKREGFLFTNLAVKQELFNKLLTATLQVRDVFGSAVFEMENSSFDFYNYRHFERESPVVMLNLRINLNNYKNNRRDNGNNDSTENDQGDYGE